MADGEIDVCLFNGGIRTSEQEYMAQLLRRKSKVLVAFGSCATKAASPGWPTSTTADRSSTPSTATRRRPRTRTTSSRSTRPRCPKATLHLPVFYDTLRTLDQTVPVDYYLPGCPPEAERIWDAITAIVEGNLPPPGSVIGAETTVCQECTRTRNEKKIKKFYRTWEIIPDEETCLLEQGLLCCGIATRAGCGALCPQVNSPCIGCYGPNEGVHDFGARLMTRLASVIDSNDPEEIDRIIREGIPDPVGQLLSLQPGRQPAAAEADA